MPGRSRMVLPVTAVGRLQRRPFPFENICSVAITFVLRVLEGKGKRGEREGLSWHGGWIVQRRLEGEGL